MNNLGNVSFLAIRKEDFIPWFEVYLGGSQLAETLIADTEEDEKIYLKDGGFVIKGSVGKLIRYKTEINVYNGFGRAALDFVESEYASECECFIRVE